MIKLLTTHLKVGYAFGLGNAFGIAIAYALKIVFDKPYLLKQFEIIAAVKNFPFWTIMFGLLGIALLIHEGEFRSCIKASHSSNRNT